MKTLFTVFFAGCLGIVLFLIGPIGMDKTKTPMDFLYLALSVAHVIWAGVVLAKFVRKTRLVKSTGSAGYAGPPSQSRAPEILASVALIVYIFSYIFATNANMDYVQRFAESEGNLRLAPDSLTERLNSLLRYLPFLMADFFFVIKRGIGTLSRRTRIDTKTVFQVFALPVALISSVLYTASIPSFLSLQGVGFLGYFCLVPLFLVLRYAPKWWGLFYGTAFGVIQTMLTNYWLGTFSLVSLQLICVVYLVLYAAFMTVTVGVIRHFGRGALLLIPFLWVLFDYLRSLGFIGYPWGFLGVSQYKFLPLIQIASVTGVWGITLIVTLANGILAFLISLYVEKPDEVKRHAGVPAVYALGFLGLLVFGAVSIQAERKESAALPPVKVALVQQNADPRKHDYEETFEVLKTQTDEAMEHQPDLVVWSETAFVPNIRRWSKMDPARYRYAKLVDEFLAYQKSLNVWLVTGNDDYELIPVDGGETERLEYNAAVLFDLAGNRVKTYRKMHLVPFTEYFPYKERFPDFYEWLRNSDVFLWEPGTERVVFEHPDVKFSTPICFEDSFPSDIRKFVLAGAELIVNISNDFWSLTEVEAQQHYANALFRAVENSRPMLRASASGVTCVMDATGRASSRLPFYQEGHLVAEVRAGVRDLSFYTRFGDWLPLYSLGMVVVSFIFSFVRHKLTERRANDTE